MKDKGYWKRRIANFIKFTLQERQNHYLNLAECIAREIEIVKNITDEHIQDNPEDFALFLYVNHELNRFNPLGIYPSVWNEYTTYAWKIVEMRKNCSQEQFSLLLFQHLKNACSGMARYDIKDDRIQTVTDEILKVIDNFYKTKKKP